MLLTLSTTHSPATDLGYLLHKHPDRVQEFALSFGRAHVFYPESTVERTTAALLLEVDPIGMVRRQGREADGLLSQYVNDRPYVASSLMSVAIAQVFGSAMSGRCKERPELVNQAIPWTARLDVLPVRSDIAWTNRLFEPLGYEVHASTRLLDERFPQWGTSPYASVELRGQQRLCDLLTHLYVLIPVFDHHKYYYVGQDELDKLLAKGQGWLSTHPEKETIARRFLKHRSNLYRQAMARLMDDGAGDEADDAEAREEASAPEPVARLNDQRYEAVRRELLASGARSVLDLGCGEGKFLRELLTHRQFERLVGMDVSTRSLELASRRLKLDQLPEKQAERLRLVQGSLVYRDERLEGFDAAALIEVIEHLDPPRLLSMAQVLFGHTRPKTILITTPNREYNVQWPTLQAGTMRHADHRFEWSRAEFQTWATDCARQHGYRVRFEPIGAEIDGCGAPTQMGVFQRD